MSNSTKKIWYKLLSNELVEKIKVGEVTKQSVDNYTIALIKLDDGFYALDNTCPHQGGPLGEGTLDSEGYVVCPWHGYQFSPRDGKAPPGYSDCVQTYHVEMREDGLYIELPEVSPQITISDQIVDVLVDWGVKVVFGMIGHSNLAMGEVLRRREKEITFVGVRHEGAAAFAASAYGKLTGEPGVCLTIAGPGATNLLTGLYDAKLDRSPVVALTGQIDTQYIGPGVFQEVDLSGTFSDVVVWHQTVLQAENASELMALALKHAIIERNVTQLILPDEIQKTEGKIHKISRKGRLSSRIIEPDAESFEKAMRILKQAERPCIIAGYGSRKYKELLVQLAEKLDSPVVTTYKAKGS